MKPFINRFCLVCTILLAKTHKFLTFPTLGSLYVILNFSNKYQKVILPSRPLQPYLARAGQQMPVIAGLVIVNLPVLTRPAYLIYKNPYAHQVIRHKHQAILVVSYLESYIS